MAEQFGKYILERRLAVGGMAEIFLATATGTAGFAKHVVLKRILPHYAHEESFQQMFFDEANIVGHMHHANVVNTFEFAQVDGIYFLVMEYIEGLDLRRIMSLGRKMGRPLPRELAVLIAHGMASGLHHAHHLVVNGAPLGLVHRDVSPHNVMVSLEGDVKVMDFGIAKATSRTTRTGTGVVKGKIAYMSPEQARGETVDIATDIFAAGIVLWEMLAGRRLFDGESDIQILNKVGRCEVPDIGAEVPDIDPQLREVTAKLLHPEKAQRYPTLGAAAHDLASVIARTPPERLRLDDYMRVVVPAPVQDELHAIGAARTKPLKVAPPHPTSFVSPSEPTAPLGPLERVLAEDADPTQSFSPGGATTIPLSVETNGTLRSSSARRWARPVIVLVAGAAALIWILADSTKPPAATMPIIEHPIAASMEAAAPIAVATDDTQHSPKPVTGATTHTANVLKKAKPKIAEERGDKPVTIATVAFINCPATAQVFDRERILEPLSKRNQQAYPVSAGRHALTLRVSGKTISLREFSISAGETEVLRCP